MPLIRDIATISAGLLNGRSKQPESKTKNSIGARKVHRFALKNLDTGEELEGQFGPINPTENPGNPNYAEHSSLNRDKPILMFTHGNSDSFSFGAQWYADHESDDTPSKKITALKKWKKRDENLGRPPLVSFRVGTEGELAFGPAVITEIGAIAYFDPPKYGGGVRGVTTTVTLRSYTEWNLVSEPAPETRYHHARTGDYYELICWHEYKNAMLGDVIRKRNPTKLSLGVGDVVPLPSAEALRTSRLRPSSIPFMNTQTSKLSPQKDLRSSAFRLHDRPYVSSIIPSGF
jgi:hypothetical protein